jgi:hypothetical protein
MKNCKEVCENDYEKFKCVNIIVSLFQIQENRLDIYHRHHLLLLQWIIGVVSNNNIYALRMGSNLIRY